MYKVIENNKNGYIQKILCIIIGIFPVLSQYLIFEGITISISLVTIIVALIIVSLKNKIKLNLKILIYFSIIIVLQVFSLRLNLGLEIQTINNTIIIIFNFIIIVTISSISINVEMIYKIMKAISVIATILLIYQIVSYNYFNRIVYLYIPFLIKESGFISI